MLISTITQKDIQIGISATNWEDAIKKAAQSMLDNKSITQSYVDAMINAVKENGPYIVITKSIALAHARPEEGVNEMALSFATLNPPINFGAGDMDPVKLIITLAAKDHDAHIDLIGELAEILTDADRVDAMANAQSATEFLELLKQ